MLIFGMVKFTLLQLLTNICLIALYFVYRGINLNGLNYEGAGKHD